MVMQPRRSTPTEGDNVMATRDCGRVRPILYSRLATRLGSIAIIIPIHLFTITRIHVCNHIPIITIRMSTRPNAPVCALTYKFIPSTRLQYITCSILTYSVMTLHISGCCSG
jgi:hypothetical protein